MKIKIISSLLLLALILPILSFAKNQNGTSTVNKMVAWQNRENNIERIRARIASTTASTTEKKMEQLNTRLQKQQEQMNRARERVLAREFKVTEVLEKIADKIAERISILEARNLDMANAKAKLAEARAKITELINKSDDLADLLAIEITGENSEEIFSDIRSIQAEIRVLAKAGHALLVETIKEITKVLPQNNKATTTATTTN